MLSLVLGLLLAGPEPATHGFLTMSHPPPDGDTYQGYAKNVVRHPHDSNFNDTMHKTEVTTCMAPSNAYQHVTPELTALLHNAKVSRLYPFIPFPVSHYPLSRLSLSVSLIPLSRIPYPVSRIPHPVYIPHHRCAALAPWTAPSGWRPSATQW